MTSLFLDISILLEGLERKIELHGLSMLANRPKFWGVLYIYSPTFIGFEETSTDWSVQF